MATPRKTAGLTATPSLNKAQLDWTSSSDRTIIQYDYRLKLASSSVWGSPVPMSGASFNQLSGDGHDIRVIVRPSNPAEDFVEIVEKKTQLINLADLDTDIQAVVSDKTALKVLAGIESELSSIATEESAIVKLASQQTSIDAIVKQQTNILALAGDATALQNLADFDSALTTLAGQQADLSAISLLKGAIVSVTNDAADIKALVDEKTSLLAVANLESDIAALTTEKTALVKVASQGSQLTALTNVTSKLLASAGSVTGLQYDQSMTVASASPNSPGEYGFYSFTNALNALGNITTGSAPQVTSPTIKTASLFVINYKDKNSSDMELLIKSIIANDVIRFGISASHYYIFRVVTIYTRRLLKGFQIELLDSKTSGVGISWKLDSQSVTIDLLRAAGYNAFVNLIKKSTDIISIVNDKSAIDALVQERTELVALANEKTGILSATAQWTLKTQVGGLVGGIGLYNDGSTTQFMVRADKFAILPTSGSASQQLANKGVPFSVSGGRVYINDAMITNLNADNITVGTLNVNRMPQFNLLTKATENTMASTNANRWSFYWEDLGTPSAYWNSGTTYNKGDITKRPPSSDSWDRLYVARRNTRNDRPEVSSSDWSFIGRWLINQSYGEDVYKYFGFQDGKTNKIYKSKRPHVSHSTNKPGQLQSGFFFSQDGTSYIRAAQIDQLDLNDINITGILSQGYISSNVKNIAVLWEGSIYLDNNSYHKFPLKDDVRLYSAITVMGRGFTSKYSSAEITTSIITIHASNTSTPIGLVEMDLGYKRSADGFTLEFKREGGANSGYIYKVLGYKGEGSNPLYSTTFDLPSITWGFSYGDITVDNNNKFWLSHRNVSSTRFISVSSTGTIDHTKTFDLNTSSIFGLVFYNNKLWSISQVTNGDINVIATSLSGSRSTSDDFQVVFGNYNNLTYYNGKFWLLDTDAKKVVVYTTSGARSSSDDFNLDISHGIASGITFGNNRFYVTDRFTSKVFAYTSSGSRDIVNDVILDANFDGNNGIAYYNNKLWVLSLAPVSKVSSYTT